MTDTDVCRSLSTPRLPQMKRPWPSSSTCRDALATWLMCRAAADAGATAWSSAFFYGQPGEPMGNIYLLGRFFKKASRLCI